MMRKIQLLFSLLVIISITTQQVKTCPSTGHHLGVIIEEATPIEEVISKLKSIGIDAKYEEIRHKLASGEYVTYDAVVFMFGQWLPPDPLGKPLPADARLYIGEKSMALKVNTSISGSREPLKKALALLYKAEVISHLPNQADFLLTEGNRVPADVVRVWASEEYGHELEQLVLRCQSKGADVVLSSMTASKETIVLANIVDAELSYPLLRDVLISKGLNPHFIEPSELSDHFDAKMIIVLGGPDAYDGVGDISEFLLSSSDSNYLRSVEDSFVVYLAQPLFEGQKIFVIAGNDRYDTKRAVEVFIEDYLEDLLEKSPSLRYEFDTSYALLPKRTTVKGYPCMLFVQVLSTLRTPCYKPVVEFQIEGNKIYIEVEYVQLPVICIQVITIGDLRIYIEDLPPGEYEVNISSPEGNFIENVSIPPCG